MFRRALGGPDGSHQTSGVRPGLSQCSAGCTKHEWCGIEIYVNMILNIFCGGAVKSGEGKDEPENLSMTTFFGSQPLALHGFASYQHAKCQVEHIRNSIFFFKYT